LWCALAAIPVLLYGVADFYGSSGVCFPLHIQYPFSNGWKYSFVILVVVNSLAMIVIAVCYIKIYRTRVKSQKNIQSTQTAAQNTALLRRMVVIVMTDAACWIPIIFLKLIAIAGISISPKAYGWVNVLVLPINSFLNPILYSIMTPAAIKWMKDKYSTCGPCK
jgi:hypothetical protein